MEPPAPFYELAEQFAIDLPCARAVFTTRRGGHSTGPHATLNLGFSTDDDREAARRNRATLERAVGAPPAAYMYQLHSADVGVIDDVASASERPRLDGRATRLRGVAPAALAADCLPVAVAGGGAVAMLHAGWRGLDAGVLTAGVRAVRALGEPDHELTAAIGPGAGPCCYEVGPEVHAAFTDHGPDVRRGDNLDLKAIAREQLRRAGVTDVHDLGMCTICSSLFFSHRRDHGLTGRHAGLAWLT